MKKIDKLMKLSDMREVLKNRLEIFNINYSFGLNNTIENFNYINFILDKNQVGIIPIGEISFKEINNIDISHSRVSVFSINHKGLTLWFDSVELW